MPSPANMTRDQRRRALEAEMSKRGWSADKRSSTRAALEDKFESEATSQFAAGRQQASSAYPWTTRLVGTPMSAVLNYGETAGLGVPSMAASALTAPITALRRDVGLGEAYRMNRAAAQRLLGANPVGRITGTLGAYVAPTPARMVAETGFRAFGGARLASAAAAESSFARAAGKQILSSVVGGAGSAGTSETAFAITDDTPLADKARRILFGVGAGAALGIPGGALAASFRAIPEQPLLKLIEKAKRIMPGYKPSPDQLRNVEGVGFLSDLMESLGRSPAGRRAVSAYMRDYFYTPLRQAVNAMKTRVGGSASQERNITRAGGAVRALLPAEQGERGLINEQIKRVGERAFQAEGEIFIARDQLAGILKVVGTMNRRARQMLGTEGARGSELGSVLKDLKNAFKQAIRSEKRGGSVRVTAQMLENLRHRLAPIAQFGDDIGRSGINLRDISARDVREAKRLYATIRATLRQSSPIIDRALSDISDLRRLANSFKPIANLAHVGDDMELVRSVFSAKDFGRRWSALTKLLPQERIQALKGSYLAGFFEEIMSSRGPMLARQEVPRISSMERLFSRTGPYRREVFDRVLGEDIRSELTEIGLISDLVSRNIGRGEGSATARRGADMALLLGAVNTVGLAAESLRDPSLGSRLVGRVLGTAGLVTFAESLISPSGRLGRTLVKLSSGEPVHPGMVFPAAFTRVMNPLMQGRQAAPMANYGAGQPQGYGSPNMAGGGQ